MFFYHLVVFPPVLFLVFLFLIELKMWTSAQATSDAFPLCQESLGSYHGNNTGIFK